MYFIFLFQSKTYDSVTEKYLDFSFEKTNSAYMLFYERCPNDKFDINELNRQQIQQQLNNFDYGGPSSLFFDQEIQHQLYLQQIQSHQQQQLQSQQQQPSCSTGSQQIIQHQQNEILIDDNKKCINFSKQNETENNNFSINSKCDINVKSNINNINTKDIILSSSTSTLSPTPSQQQPSSSSLLPENTTATTENSASITSTSYSTSISNTPKYSLLNKELEELIWQDNRHFLQDRNIFEHTYFR